MASVSYLDDIKNSLDKLPEELHRNFSLMQELDSRSQKLMNNIDKMADNYMSNVKEYSFDKKKETMASIQRQFDTAKAYSDDKVQLSIQTYELVDKHIRKLDAELLRFKEKIQLKTDMCDAAIKEGLKMISARPSASVTDPSNSTNIVDNVAVETNSLSGALVGTGIENSAYADMPIDPNEPRFCLCNQVSFGEMIGCDNPDCDIEWFHFACVSLINKPEGKWICPKCITDKKKK